MYKRAFLIVALAAAPAAAQQPRPAARQARTAPADATPRRAEGGARERVDPRADAVLRRMSDYLRSLSSFRVRSDATDEVVTRDGHKLQFVTESQVTMRRPNMVMSQRTGPVADVTFRYDGHEFSLYGTRNGYYATAPAPAQLDEAVDELRGRYGLDIPGADLLSENPYATLMEDTTGGEYIGEEPIDGVRCHHLAFHGREVDWQLWVQDGAQPLPRRYVITSRRVQGAPEFAVSLSRWEPNVAAAPAQFTLRPPSGSTRIELYNAPREPARGGGERGGR